MCHGDVKRVFLATRIVPDLLRLQISKVLNFLGTCRGRAQLRHRFPSCSLSLSLRAHSCQAKCKRVTTVNVEFHRYHRHKSRKPLLVRHTYELQNETSVTWTHCAWEYNVPPDKRQARRFARMTNKRGLKTEADGSWTSSSRKRPTLGIFWTRDPETFICLTSFDSRIRSIGYKEHEWMCK